MSWYLVMTRSGGEHVAEGSMTRQGFTVYNPRVAVERIRNGELAEIHEPAFAGYVFVEFDPETQSAYKINNSRGVFGIVKFGGQIAKVPNSMIYKIRSSLEDKKMRIAPAAGEAVEIKTGPFAGLSGIFLEPSGSKRSRIMLQLLGRNEPVTMDNVNFG